MKRKQIIKKLPVSLHRRLLFFVLLCWIVPVGVFFTFTTISYREGIIEKAEKLMEEEIKNVVSVMSIRINETISLSQRPSYEKTWENCWKLYKQGVMSKRDFLININATLRGKFYQDERFNTYAFYAFDDEKPSCYASRIGTSYNDYVEAVQDDISEIMEYNTSYTYVRIFRNRMYIIRNLYTTSEYEHFGTLVVELNVREMFDGITDSMKHNMLIMIEDKDGVISFFDKDSEEDQKILIGKLTEEYTGKENGKLTGMSEGSYNGYLYQHEEDYYNIGILVTMKRSELYESLYVMYKVAFLMLLFFIPIICYGIHFLRRQIQRPVERLADALNAIEEGKLGTVVEGDAMPNQEFQFLMESLNSMSAQMKYLFDSVYNEKLARKDAQIQALTAQINPHFLNNTLEMMNWQARMSNDTVISKMIEALGTVLDHRINRAEVKVIHLSEELHCTEAYIYIMSMRFGQRLSIEREIDEELLYMDVPPLILQPLVENAVVHGVEFAQNGSIRLSIFHDRTYVYLQVDNSGKRLEDEEIERLAQILAGNEEALPKEQGRHTSIGIRNVNKRIQLVYGEEYGLTITRSENDRTVSTVRLPYIARINK